MIEHGLTCYEKCKKHDNNKQKNGICSNHFRSVGDFFASFSLALLVTSGRPLVLFLRSFQYNRLMEYLVMVGRNLSCLFSPRWRELQKCSNDACLYLVHLAKLKSPVSLHKWISWKLVSKGNEACFFGPLSLIVDVSTLFAFYWTKSVYLVARFVYNFWGY